MNTLSLNTYLESLYLKAKYDLFDYIEMLYIQEKSKKKTIINEYYFNGEIEISSEQITIINEKLIYDFLQKRGYVENFVLGKKIMTKGFVCVFVSREFIQVFHDIENCKPMIIKESFLTSLPITLNYMEKIN